MQLHTFLQQKDIPKELQNVIFEIANVGKAIRREIQKHNTINTATLNASGDMQMQLDKCSNEVAYTTLKKTYQIRDYASEEEEDIKTINSNAAYSIAIDPLDGSSLIDVNLAIGTVVGIHLGSITTEKRGIIAAMYILYGPLTTLVISPEKGKGTHEFMLDEDLCWVLARENITCKEKGKIYSPGGERRSWNEKQKQYITQLEQEGYKLRFSGCLVADANHVLLKQGGVFCYPTTADAPSGKLRVLYELEPLTFMFEEAGGRGSDGKQSFINKPIINIHQKSAAYLGSRYEVELAEQMMNK